MSGFVDDDGAVLVDEQGHEWTLLEWEEHAADHGIIWHIRLDGSAIIEGEPWEEGGAVLLEPKR